MTDGSRGVLLPLAVAFFIYWLGTLDLAKAVGRYTPVTPRQPVKAAGS